MLKDKYDFDDLVELIKFLRSEKGCPWDKEQDHESLKKHLIEETYEVLEAIDLKDKDKLCEELGDLLLQIIFHAQIGNENHDFSIDDIITGICKKIITRHTHIFGSDNISTSEGVEKNWELVKKKEKGMMTYTEVLKAVPNNLPALMRSYKIQQKAAQVGFDWNDIEDVFNKVYEEILELKDVYKSKNVERIKDEMGDIIFAVVNVSRFLSIQPELALTHTINKFIDRFEYIEKESIKHGKKLEDMTLEEMDKLWEQAKINLLK